MWVHINFLKIYLLYIRCIVYYSFAPNILQISNKCHTNISVIFSTHFSFISNFTRLWLKLTKKPQLFFVL
jgi:hypothetical protein